MPKSADYHHALRHVLDAVRRHDDGGDGRIALSKLRAELTRIMDANGVENILQSMVQDDLLKPARADGTVALTAAGREALRRSARH